MPYVISLPNSVSLSLDIFDAVSASSVSSSEKSAKTHFKQIKTHFCRNVLPQDTSGFRCTGYIDCWDRQDQDIGCYNDIALSRNGPGTKQEQVECLSDVLQDIFMVLNRSFFCFLVSGCFQILTLLPNLTNWQRLFSMTLKNFLITFFLRIDFFD